MMLDNQELISTLEDTKTKSIEIAEKLELAKVTSEEIDVRRKSPQLILPLPSSCHSLSYSYIHTEIA
jgi:hypothetical protein